MPNTTVRDPSGARPAFGVAKFVDGDTDPTKAGFNVNSSAAVELWDAAGVVRQSIGATTMDIKDSAGVARFSYTATATQIKDSGGHAALALVNSAAFSRSIFRFVKTQALAATPTVLTVSVPNVTCAGSIIIRCVMMQTDCTTITNRTSSVTFARTAGAVLPTIGVSAAGATTGSNTNCNNGGTAITAMGLAIALDAGNTTTNTNLFTITNTLTGGAASPVTVYYELEMLGINLDTITIA